MFGLHVILGQKTGLILSKNPFFSFFFWSSPNFGQKNGLILSGEIFFLVFIIFKFPAPPFENPVYATARMFTSCYFCIKQRT